MEKKVLNPSLVNKDIITITIIHIQIYFIYQLFESHLPTDTDLLFFTGYDLFRALKASTSYFHFDKQV